MVCKNKAYYEFVSQVSVRVRKVLDKEPWFRGVCLDGIEAYYEEGDLEGAFLHAHDETIYYDRPRNLD